MLDQNEEDLETLAETCLKTAKQIKEYLAANKYPQPSFDQNGPSSFPPTTPEIQQARLDLRTASQRLYDLAAGPEDIVTWYVYQTAHDLNAFRYVYHYKIAEAIPPNSTITYSELAKSLSLDTSQLKQMLRQLMTLHVFAEPIPNHIVHTSSSLLLAQHPGIASFNHYMANETFPYCANQYETLQEWGQGRPEPNKTAVSHYYGHDASMFEIYERYQPDVRNQFATLMTHMSSSPLMANSLVADGFPWSSLPEGSTVVDIAGGMGHCSIPIAQSTHESVKITVQDLPNIIAKASDPKTCVIPTHLRPRFEFAAHDMFTPQPQHPSGTTTIFFLRMIFHSYSDTYALRILNAIIPSLANSNRSTSKIVIMDQVMPDTMNSLPEPLERAKRTQDLQMMLLCNARERNRQDWEELIARVGEQEHAVNEGGRNGEGATGQDGEIGGTGKLAILNIRTPPGSMMSLIEIGFVEPTQSNGVDNGETPFS